VPPTCHSAPLALGFLAGLPAHPAGAGLRGYVLCAA
jgi:hypothetical protein